MKLASAAAAVVTLFTALAPAAATPRVVASIQPLHSLTAGMMVGVGKPYLLVPGAASPHTYSLKPSDARALQEAQAIVWVGSEIETFLTKPLRALAGKAQVIEAARLEGIVQLPAREGGVWAPREHEEYKASKNNGKQHAEPGNPDHERDLHIWLNPQNARVIVRALARVLGRIDPANDARYQANAAYLEKRLAALDVELRAQLAPIRGKPYILFHDAYQHFERRYGLSPVGSLTVSPERRPGARRLHEIRSEILRRKAVCVFREPQFAPTLIQTVVEGTQARIGVLDPLGASLPPGPDAYFGLMRGLADGFASCLSPKRNR